MTTLQIAQMIARRTPWKTVTALQLEDANALVVAINQALQVWHDKANATHIAQQRAATLHGPVQVPGTATQGHTAITFTVEPVWLASDGIGCSVQVSGDPKWNRLMSTTRLLMPYSGPTGDVTLILHHDVAPLGNDTVSVCSNVRLVRGGSTHNERILQNADVPACWQAAGHVRWQGDPEIYQVESHNPGANSAPFFVLRVWPMPTQELTLAYNVGTHWSMTLADLQTPRDLPLPEDVASGIVLPIALDRAAGQALLVPETDFRRVQADAAAAEARIYTRTMIPVTDPQWMGTPPGY